MRHGDIRSLFRICQKKRLLHAEYIRREAFDQGCAIGHCAAGENRYETSRWNGARSVDGEWLLFVPVVRRPRLRAAEYAALLRTATAEPSRRGRSLRNA